MTSTLNRAMFVRTAADVRAAGFVRSIRYGTAIATRYLTARDGLGFSLSTGFKRAPHQPVPTWYKHHWEANFVASGSGELEELSTGRRWPLEPGTVYAVGPDDRYQGHGSEDILIVSVFNPPLVGDETHDADGAYPPTGPLPPGPQDRRMFVRTATDARATGRERVIGQGAATATHYLTKSDGLGFSLSTMFKPGGLDELQLWYRHRWSANFIVSGSGELEELSSGQRWPLEPGTVYVVGPNDHHKVHGAEDMLIVSVFNPPMVDDEAPDAGGSYPPSGPLSPGPKA